MKKLFILFCSMALSITLPEDVVGQAVVGNTESFIVQVKGVGCNEDVKSIAANIEKLEGVVKCKPLKRGATTRFEVEYESATTTMQQIYIAVEDTPGCKNPKSRPYKVKNKDG